MKYVSLLIYYNSGAATLATILVSAALGVAVACDFELHRWILIFGLFFFVGLQGFRVFCSRVNYRVWREVSLFRLSGFGSL